MVVRISGLTELNYRELNYRKLNYRELNYRELNYSKLNYRKLTSRKPNFSTFGCIRRIMYHTARVPTTPQLEAAPKDDGEEL
jgi:hypothetical protein